MTTIVPQSEMTKRAIAWISEKLEQEGGQSTPTLIEEAAARFNLSPKDEEFLHRFYKENHSDSAR